MRSLLVTLVFMSALFARPASSQCSAYGQVCSSSGMVLTCVNSPIIGTNWTIGERSGTACGLSSAAPGTMFTMIGLCFAPGLPIDPPLACGNCGGCLLHVLPSLAELQWTWPPRTTALFIPSDPNLLGATLCIQDVCVNATSACVCMSGALQVVIQ